MIVRTFLLAALLLSTPARAQDAVQLATLEAHAKKARGSLSGGDARIDEARARVQAARAAYAPSINLLGEASLSPGGRVITVDGYSDDPLKTQPYKVAGSRTIGQDGAFTPTPRYGVTLDLRGNLYDFGRTASAVEAAEAQRRAAQADTQREEQQIVRDVRAAYVRWSTAYALWTLSERAAQAAGERQARTKAAIEEGAARSADRTAAESDAGFAQLELERARANLESAREDLGFLALVDLPADARPADDVLGAGLPAAREPEQDASLRALQEQRRAAQATAEAHDHALAPVIGATAQAGLQANQSSVFPLYRVGINVSVPLWDGGADAANRGQARARAAQLSAQAAQYEQAREQRRKRGALIQAQAERRIGMAQQLVQLCSTRLSQLEEGYPLGAASFLDLADAQSALSRAQSELVLAQAMRAEAALELY
jgi:outer membrane protein TolC